MCALRSQSMSVVIPKQPFASRSSSSAHQITDRIPTRKHCEVVLICHTHRINCAIRRMSHHYLKKIRKVRTPLSFMENNRDFGDITVPVFIIAGTAYIENIINGRAEIRNFSSSVEKYFTQVCKCVFGSALQLKRIYYVICNLLVDNKKCNIILYSCCNYYRSTVQLLGTV